MLFGILIALLSVTYVFQENKNQKEFLESKTKDHLVLGPIEHFKISGLEIIKKKNQWFAGHELVSYNTLNQLEKKIQEIKKIKNLDGAWESYFAHPITMEVNHTLWTIGEMSLDRQGFYLAIGKEKYLVFFDGDSHELVQDDKEIEATKLNEFKHFISKDLASLKEKQLFRFFPDLVLDRVQIKSEGQMGYELDLTQNKTLPAPISGISVHSKMKDKFFSLLTQMMIKDELPSTFKGLHKRVGSIIFINPDSKTRTWELWLTSKVKSEAILKDVESGRSFSMVGGTLKAFLLHQQDYWDKKIIPLEFFKSFTQIDMQLTQGKEQVMVSIFNKEPLEFRASRGKVDSTKMNELIQLLFNLGTHDQADRVSLLSSTDKQLVLNGDYLRIEIMGQELVLWQKNEELIVVNLTQKYKAHFGILKENFSTRFADMIK